MSEYLGLAAAATSIGGSIASLLQSKPKAPQIGSIGTPNAGLQLGFGNALTTPGYGFSGGNLYKSPLGEAYSDSIGGFLIGGGMDTMRAKQTGDAIGQINQTRAGLGEGLKSIADLRAQVQPGFGALTDARVTAIRDAAAESIGNLRDSLARRGVMGSSFADDAVSRTRLAFAREEQAARAEAKVAEISAQSQLISQELGTFAQMLGLTQLEAGIKQQDISNAVTQANLISNEVNRQLQEFSVAGNIANQVTAVVSNQAVAEARLQMLTQIQSGQDTAGALKTLSGGLSSLSKIDFSNIFGEG